MAVWVEEWEAVKKLKGWREWVLWLGKQMCGVGEERVAFNEAHSCGKLGFVESATVSAGGPASRRPGEDF